jgi:hypothetical protein
VALGRVAGGTAAVRRRPGPAGRPSGRAPGLTPGRASGRAAGRGPFAALVVLILAGGLIALLMLNTALNQGSFTLTKLQQRTNRLTDERQGLQQQISAWSAPNALSLRAGQLGMVPGGNPAFLRDNGAILGNPQRLTGGPTPASASVSALASAPASGPTPASASAPASPSASPSPVSVLSATGAAASGAAAPRARTGAAPATRPTPGPSRATPGTPAGAAPTPTTPTGNAH